jgi:hypothetical protein
MDVDYDEWAMQIVHNACLAVIRYEEHLRSKETLKEAKALAKAMRLLRESVPDEILETMRD